VLAITHFVLRVKKDLTEPALYGAVVAALFLIRIGAAVRARRAARPF
jgi:sulfoxide reductase heme-binding subunit YedZ